MTPYPTALFKDGVMRTAKNKSTLKIFLLEEVKPTENTESEIIADGGALLWLCYWRKREKLAKYLTCTQINVGSLILIQLCLMGTINRRKMLHTKKDLIECLGS